MVLSELENKVEGVDPLLLVTDSLSAHNDASFATVEPKEVRVVAIGLSSLEYRIRIDPIDVLHKHYLLLGVRLLAISENPVLDVEEEVTELEFIHIQISRIPSLLLQIALDEKGPCLIKGMIVHC